MRKKINVEFMLIAAVAIILTGIFATFTYYGIFQKEVFGSLRTCAHVLAETIPENAKTYRIDEEDVRITVVGSDGTVLMDSNADIGDMANHGKRPEIIEAFTSGEGREMRRSETLDKSTFYYAMRLENGNVLRVAKEAGSILSMFCDAIPSFAGIAAVLFVFCALLGHFLTKSIIRPIEKIILKNGLFPFGKQIRLLSFSLRQFNR